mgnify:CR=1 FL=1
MKRILSSLLSAAAMLLAACGGANRPALPDFQEMTDPAAAFADWSAADAVPHASFVTTDRRFGKSQLPAVEPQQTCRLTAWRGERVSAQLLVWSAQPVEKVVCKVGRLTSEKGTLPDSALRARFVRYVMSDEFACGCCKRQPENFAAVLSADMLDERPSMALDACTVRPVWITVDVPQDAAPGLYRAPVTLSCDGSKERLELEVAVTSRTLPAPSEWGYHLDLWQHPAAVARVEGVEPWSDAHFEALKPVMKLLADAGQKVVTATLNKDPWNNQCYDAYADMIVWTKGADGTWSYDYTAFDRWVELMEGLGVDEQINCYSMLPWNNSLHYRDAVTGEWVDVIAEPGQPAFDEMWRPFLTDFVRHLDAKGWLAKSCIAMDERSPEQMEIAVAFLAEHAPQLGIALADNHNSYKRYAQLHDICVSARQEVAREDIAARRAAGQVTTYYVCCSHRYPNMFTFSDPAESTAAAWYAVANDYDGFLRWAYNSWTEEPLRDSRFRTWPAGDTYVVYPGARSSIRFERLREGIQDAEKIRVLRAELSRENSIEANRKREQLEATVAPFASREPGDDLHERLAAAKQLLNEL